MLAAPLPSQTEVHIPGGGFRGHSPAPAHNYMAQHGGEEYATHSFEPVPAASPDTREPSGSGAGAAECDKIGLEQLLPKHTHVLIR